MSPLPSFVHFVNASTYMLVRLKCVEAPEEPPSITVEKVLKIECNININTNFMQSGIMNVCPAPRIPRLLSLTPEF